MTQASTFGEDGENEKAKREKSENEREKAIEIDSGWESSKDFCQSAVSQSVCLCGSCATINSMFSSS